MDVILETYRPSIFPYRSTGSFCSNREVEGIDMAAKQEVQWMTQPQAPLGCPPGLEYLTQIDQLLVQQQVELLECWLQIVFLKRVLLSYPCHTVLTGCETRNKYRVLNSVGQQIYFAQEGMKFLCCAYTKISNFMARY